MTDAATATTPAGLTTGQKDAKSSLRSLLPLLPFALRYRGRIAAALLALLVASSATLGRAARGTPHGGLRLLG